MTKTCPNCRGEVPLRAQVCGYCGHRLAGGETPKAPSVPPPPAEATTIPAIPATPLTAADPRHRRELGMMGAVAVLFSTVLPWGLVTGAGDAYGLGWQLVGGYRSTPRLPIAVSMYLTVGGALLILGASALIAVRSPRPWPGRILGLVILTGVALVAARITWLAGGDLQSIVGVGPIVAVLGAVLLLTGR